MDRSNGISLALLRPMAEMLGRLEVDRVAFLTSLGVDNTIPPNTYVAANRVDIQLAEIAARHGDPAFGLTLARIASVHPLGRSQRMIAYDTPIPVMRTKEWIAALERAIGYVPCVHPEEHYGRDFVDIDAIVAHPIARDAHIMARRGFRCRTCLAKARPQ